MSRSGRPGCAIDLLAGGERCDYLLKSRLRAEGRSNAGIAQQLWVTEGTVARTCTASSPSRSRRAEQTPTSIETAVYFLVAEALTNATEHAEASSMRIGIQHRDGRVPVRVVDDGVGGATLTPGGGLSGLRDRIEALGGHLSLENPVGKGAHLTGEIPCA